MFLLVLPYLLSMALAQELTTPSSLLRPRNFNHHAFHADNNLHGLQTPGTTKQGPVLFPNDAPRPPRPPLIVTSRPLLESIARSELNNSLAQPSLINRSFLPALTREYKPFFLPSTPRYDVTERQFGDDDYEDRTALPPIYKALSDHANRDLIRLKSKPLQRYQVKEPDYSQDYVNNDIGPGNVDDNSENQNYAFSYTVRDRKTGDDFSHSQQSRGSATNGEYRVRLPDGRMQIVSYTADENGYKADVRYDDEPKNNNKISNTNNVYENNDNHVNVNNNYDYNSNNNYINHDYSDIRNSDTQRQYKIDHNNDRDKFDYYSIPDTDVSKEYQNEDYSSEYNTNYEPHKSKFTSFIKPTDYIQNTARSSTVRPSYEELKDLFIPKKFDVESPSEYNVPTVSSFETTTERVVVIGGKPLYTNIRNSVPLYGSAVTVTPKPVTEIPILYSTPPPTPMSYLVSTIANLRNKISLGTKPVLTDRFIDKINKYLSFN